MRPSASICVAVFALLLFVGFCIAVSLTSRYAVVGFVAKDSNPPIMKYYVYRQGRDGPLISFDDKIEADQWVKAAEKAEKK